MLKPPPSSTKLRELFSCPSKSMACFFSSSCFWKAFIRAWNSLMSPSSLARLSRFLGFLSATTKLSALSFQIFNPYTTSEKYLHDTCHWSSRPVSQGPVFMTLSLAFPSSVTGTSVCDIGTSLQCSRDQCLHDTVTFLSSVTGTSVYPTLSRAFPYSITDTPFTLAVLTRAKSVSLPLSVHTSRI